MAIELELSSLNLISVFLGLFIILYGSFSYLIKERLFLGEAPIAVLLGICLGPYGLGKVLGWNESDGDQLNDDVSLAMSRVVIGIQLTLVGVQLPYKYPWLEFTSLFMLLVPVMTLMWLVTTACIWLTLPGVPLLVALVISTCATPTDPVLSNAIVKGAFADQYVSPRLRNLISAESGANDGFGYPFLFLAVHLLKAPTTSKAMIAWVLETCLYNVLGSVVWGTFVGYLCLRLLEFSTNKNWIDKESFLLYGTGMGIFIVGSGGALAVDDLLACFVAGNVLTWNDWYREECEDDELQNCIDLLLNQVFFIFLGATIPFDAFNDPENGVTPIRLVALCALVLIFRRLPAMIAFYRLIPSLRDISEAAFMGYFGPIGAGALFYCALVLHEFKEDDGVADHQQIRTLVKPVTYALIISSLIGHTLMIPVVKAYFQYRGIEAIKIVGQDESVGTIEEEDEVGDEEQGGEESDGGEGTETGDERLTASGTEEGDDEMTEARRHSIISSIRSSYVPETSVHRPLEYGNHPHHTAGGAHHIDGSWDPKASWRTSTGHKLAPHHQFYRNERGELEFVREPEDLPSAWTQVGRSFSRERRRRRRSSKKHSHEGVGNGNDKGGGGGSSSRNRDNESDRDGYSGLSSSTDDWDPESQYPKNSTPPHLGTVGRSKSSTAGTANTRASSSRTTRQYGSTSPVVQHGFSYETSSSAQSSSRQREQFQSSLGPSSSPSSSRYGTLRPENQRTLSAGNVARAPARETDRLLPLPSGSGGRAQGGEPRRGSNVRSHGIGGGGGGSGESLDKKRGGHE